MDRKARLKIVSQIVGAGKRKFEHARKHCINGGLYVRINNVLTEIDRVEKELKYYEREN